MESREDLTELLAEVRRIEVQSRRLVTDVMAGGYKSAFRGSGVQFDEVREYVPGDDPRTVDWSVTARTGRPHIKKYVEERELTVVFLLDLSASLQGGFSRWSLRQAAARFCGCLALSAVRSGDNVGLIGFSDEVEQFVPAGKGMAHALRIIRDALALHPQKVGTSVSSGLDFAARVLRRGSVVFLISDFLDHGYGRSLARCARRHDVVAVRLTPPEHGSMNPQAAVVRDPESGRSWNLSGLPGEWQALRERVAAWRAATDSELRRARVDLLDISLPREPDRDVIAKPLLRFFRMREERRAHS